MTTLEQEKRLQIFIKSGWECDHCGGYLNRYSTPQLGHRISQTKYNIKKYGKDIIHHPLNMKAVCSIKCNSAVAIGKSMSEQINSLVNEIKRELGI